MTYKTRSERHEKKHQNKTFDKKTLLPLVGSTLIVAPTVAMLAPQTVDAQEYQVSENSAEQLINQIGWTAADIAASNDLYASVMIAQAILETGNGTSLLSAAPYYNLFGVKSYGEEATVWLPTLEFLEGQWVTLTEPFRAYGSYWESLQHHAAILTSHSYSTGVANYAGTWKSQTTSYYDATAYLTGRYATDPSYNQKLNWLIEAYNLTRFDTSSEAINYTYTETNVSTASTTTSASGTGVHTVVAGDTLWDLATNYGYSVDQLMANNGLTSDLIVVGQQLIV